MNDMWTALERYQPFADRHGFGAEWRRMTTERTPDAAKAAAAWAAYAARRAEDAAWAVRRAEDAAWAAARGAPDAAIEHINRAIAKEMNDQPEALRVAAELDDLALKACGSEHLPLERVAARLLREQHAEIEELREAVKAEREECRKIAANMQFSHSLTPPHSTAYNIAAAISARGLPR